LKTDEVQGLFKKIPPEGVSSNPSHRNSIRWLRSGQGGAGGGPAATAGHRHGGAIAAAAKLTGAREEGDSKRQKLNRDYVKEEEGEASSPRAFSRLEKASRVGRRRRNRRDPTFGCCWG